MIRRERQLSLLHTVLLGAFSAELAQAQEENPPAPIVLLVDDDDDDANGVADVQQSTPLAGVLAQQLIHTGSQITRIDGSSLRVWSEGRPYDAASLTRPVQAALAAAQGVHPGLARVELSGRTTEVDVLQVQAIDTSGAWIDPARSHASLSREIAPSLRGDAADLGGDPDGLRFRVVGPARSLPTRAELQSWAADGRSIDGIAVLPFLAEPCPANVAAELRCVTSPFVRTTSDALDRSHPMLKEPSLRAEVGGRLQLKIAGNTWSLRVGGPRKTKLGSIGRMRGKLRFHVLRSGPGGDPAVGGSERGARIVAQHEQRVANTLWGQCGIHFGEPAQTEVHVVDPPPAFLLAVGCNWGLPASGGALRFAVGQQSFEIEVQRGELPQQVAERVAARLNQANLQARLSQNPKVGPAAAPTVDVLVYDAKGQRMALHAEGPVSTDATLGVCLGEVNFSDGLDHFVNSDAFAGTVEERTVIKAYQDDDPSSIEVFIVPHFSGNGRIGESFVDGNGSPMQNIVVLDRAGLRAGARSFALAHELGHILMDLPGHPDDAGVDRPTLLMDSDAADSTSFGPRRLRVVDCERAILQSGQNARVPLLTDWPLFGK